MGPYILKRVLLFIPTLLFVSTAVSFLVHLVPGDPVELLIGEQALPADRELYREALGLDRPLGEQYRAFLFNLPKGNLGVSLFDRREVGLLIWGRLPASLELAAASLVVALLMAIPLGLTAALRKDSVWDRGVLAASMFGISTPNFLLGPLFILFLAIGTGWFPVSGRLGLSSLFLPALTLGTGMSALLTRMWRASWIEALREDFIRTARAKGLPEKSILLRHGLRAAMNPVLTVLGLQLGAVLTGAIVTEKIFAWPGIGSLLVSALERRDYPVIQGAVLTIAPLYTFVNLLTDLAYAKVDPRIRLGGS